MGRKQIIGSDLRFLRRCAALTQKQLAREVGIGRSTLSSYERGKTEPSVEVIYEIVRAIVRKQGCNLAPSIKSGLRSAKVGNAVSDVESSPLLTDLKKKSSKKEDVIADEEVEELIWSDVNNMYPEIIVSMQEKNMENEVLQVYSCSIMNEQDLKEVKDKLDEMWEESIKNREKIYCKDVGREEIAELSGFLGCLELPFIRFATACSLKKTLKHWEIKIDSYQCPTDSFVSVMKTELQDIIYRLLTRDDDPVSEVVNTKRLRDMSVSIVYKG